MGGNRPSKVEEAVKPLTTGINVLGTVLLFVPGAQPFGIGILVASNTALAINQIAEGEYEHAVKNLALGGLAAMPVMGEIAGACNAGVKTIETLGTAGRCTSIAGNTTVSIARTVDAVEKKDVRGAILNIAGIGLGIGSGAGVSIGGLDGEKVINTTNLVVNGVYAVDATIQTGKNIDRMVKREDVDWCDTINSTCTLVSSAKLVHSSAKKLNEKQVQFERRDFLQGGREPYLDKTGKYYVKNNLTKQEAEKYVWASENKVGPPCIKQRYTDDGITKYRILTPAGMKVADALQQGLITKDEATSQFLDYVKVLHQNKKVHGDMQPGNMICSLEGKIFLIDFDTLTDYGKAEVIPRCHDGIASKRTDLKNNRIYTCIELCAGAEPGDIPGEEMVELARKDDKEGARKLLREFQIQKKKNK